MVQGATISEERLMQLTEIARLDDWYMHLVGSDIREMLVEIERLRETIRRLTAE